MIEHKVEQGSGEWFALRSGMPTSSEFDQIMTPKTMKPSDSRHKYACRLILERIMNYQPQSLEGIAHIQAGKDNEPRAARQMTFSTGLELRTCGFMTDDKRRWGASPDRMAIRKNEEPCEIKCPTDVVQMQYLLLDQDVYRCQRQGQLFVAEADKSHFYAWHERMPELYVEQGRDEPFIHKLSQALEQFHEELELLLDRAKSLGLFQPYEVLHTPLDRDLGSMLRG